MNGPLLPLLNGEIDTGTFLLIVGPLAAAISGMGLYIFHDLRKRLDEAEDLLEQYRAESEPLAEKTEVLAKASLRRSRRPRGQAARPSRSRSRRSQGVDR